MTSTFEETDLFIWQRACAVMVTTQGAVDQLLEWGEHPTTVTAPNLVELLVGWVEVYDLTRRLERTPLGVPMAELPDLVQQGVASLEALKAWVVQVNAMMRAVEVYHYQAYNSQLNLQLRRAIQQYQPLQEAYVAHPSADEVLDELLLARDQLEYLRIALNVIRMDQPRLNSILYTWFRSELTAADVTLRPALRQVNLSKALYAPRTFWWRRAGE